MKRTDIHAPSKIKPEDYHFVAALIYKRSIDNCGYLMHQRSILDKHMELTKGTYSNHHHGGNCHICGAHMIHTAVFYHAKTNSYIETGFDCALKLDMGDRGVFKRCKTEYAALRKAKAGFKKARALLRENDLLEFTDSLFDVGFNYGRRMLAYQNKKTPTCLKELIHTFNSITDKLSLNGSLSEKQWDFLKKLKNDIINFESNQKKKEQEQATIPDAPEGRHEITGVVLGLKWVENYYGPETLKWLIKTEKGYKVWSTVPSPLRGIVEREDKVNFKVTLTPSKNDSKFAYGKRPSAAKILN